jgi:glutathione S-transferase
MPTQLHNFLCSGTSHRLRIALNRKGMVPALMEGDRVLTQSLAIASQPFRSSPCP